MARTNTDQEREPGVYISKTLIAAVAVVAAIVVGWMARDFLDQLDLNLGHTGLGHRQPGDA